MKRKVLLRTLASPASHCSHQGIADLIPLLSVKQKVLMEEISISAIGAAKRELQHVLLCDPMNCMLSSAQGDQESLLDPKGACCSALHGGKAMTWGQQPTVTVPVPSPRTVEAVGTL